MPPTQKAKTRIQKTDWSSVFVFALLATACASTPPSSPPLSPAMFGEEPSRPEVSGSRSSSAELGEVEATARFCEAGPEAAIARGRAHVAAAEVSRASTLPNPALSGSHDRSLNGPQDHETVVGLQIPLSVSGQRGLLKDAAAARLAQTQLEAAHDRLMSALLFRQAFVRAAVARARLEALNDQLETYRALTKKLERLRQGGERTPLDRDRLQVEAELSAAQATAQERDLAAQRTWLEVVLDAPIALSGKLEHLAGSEVGISEKDSNLKIAALEKSAVASEMEAAAAERNAVPDVDLFAGYRVVGSEAGDTGHGFSLSLKVPLTLFDRGQADTQRAKARASLSAARIVQEKRDAKAIERAALAQLDAVARALPRLGQALKLAKRTERGAERLYFAGEGELLDVLQATRSRTELQLALIEMAAARAEAKLSLVRARGRFPEDRLDAACSGVQR